MEYTREEAVAKLMSELEKGWKSGEEEGWLTAEDVRAHFLKSASMQKSKLLCSKPRGYRGMKVQKATKAWTSFLPR